MHAIRNTIEIIKDTGYVLLDLKEKYIKEKNFLLIVSFLIGICTAFAAIILKSIIHLIQHFLMVRIDVTHINYLYLIYPIVGILLSGLFIQYVVKEDIGHGITKILYAISQRKSRIKSHNTWTSIIASSITIGFGGSVGAEAPIVLTGSAIGSNLGRLFKMEQKNLMLLVGCGAAGAIAGIFKAPIAGLIFTIEVLMLDLTMASVLPLLISSVTAATVSYIFTGTDAMFRFTTLESFTMGRIPSVLLLGVVCGLVSLYFTRTMIWIEGVFRKSGSFWKRFALGGILLSVLIFLLPPLYGEGYDTIGTLLSKQSAELLDGSFFYGIKDNYWTIIGFSILIVLFKVFASSATNGGGGCGGIFAPSLFLGCFTGFIFSHSTNYFNDSKVLLFGSTPHLPEENFALLGMAGVMSAVMHAPLTAVFLIAELTGGYDLFLPLMMVSIGSYLTILSFERHSIYSKRLAQKGELLTHHKDKAVLTLLNVQSIVEMDLAIIHPEMSLGDVVKVIAKSKRNVFPVVDKEEKLKGIVLLDDIRNIMFRPELYEQFYVETFMVSPPAKIMIQMPMEKIMRIFDDTGSWNLPVINETGKYMGFVSKSKIFNAYREVLVENFSE